MIPKIIHYCWFGGGPKGKKELKCIDSWKRYCPDYEIIEWNEANVDLDIMPFVREAYDAQKYAFVSDVIRLLVLINNGGVYFDTDVEVIKPFDNFLKYKGFSGFETPEYVASGLCIGCEKGNKIVQEMFEYYKTIHFLKEDGTLNYVNCPRINTAILENHGLKRNGEFQVVDGFAVFPIEYFNPYDDLVGKLNLTENTYSIHWYSKSWLNKNAVIRSKISKPLHRLQRMLRGKNG